MGFWRRLVSTVRQFVSRQADTVEAPPTAPPPRGGSSAPIERAHRDRLPAGWVLAGLYHEGEKTPRIHATDETDVTDSEIRHADALIVWYEDAGEDGYRWVHGATGWDSLADQIERTVIVVSPAAE